ncbi:MAG: F0F1 ATP synthase subunit B [Coleofasciculaceae cyanobacterium SM2_3_26]|nr:F0F1 ATP synthase subunit B [Coleofasciculaceae cyanobacterium SM2_3_26]
MGNFFVLATEAGGFGFNFDILGTNLVNLVIIIGVLVYFGRQFLGNILSERQSAIRSSIQEAEQRQKQAAESLADAQQNLAQAQAEAERLRKEAEERAQVVKEGILTQALKDVERVKADANRELSSEQDRAIAAVRRQVLAMALEKAEADLKGRLDESAQRALLDRSIAMLGGKS